MNDPLSLKHAQPSKAEQARRLELFEIALREERIEQLEAKLAETSGMLNNSFEREQNGRELSQRLIDNLKRDSQLISKLEAELKTLRALNPDRLKAQVKRLQKEKAEATDSIKELRIRNQQLTKQNRQLDLALNKAIADMNAGMELKAERVFELPRVGRWELFTCSKDGWYQMLDVENEVSQTVRVEAGQLVTPKMRPVPKAIAKDILKFHQEYFGGWA